MILPAGSLLPNRISKLEINENVDSLSYDKCDEIINLGIGSSSRGKLCVIGNSINCSHS